MRRLTEVLLSRTLMFVLMGLCVGFCINLLLVSLLDGNCSTHGKMVSERLPLKKRPVVKSLHGERVEGKFGGFVENNIGYSGGINQGENEKHDKKNSEDFTLRYKSKEELERVNSSLRSKVKLQRPRFVSTELGIRDKLVSAVLTHKDTYETLGVAVNNTYQSISSKLLFFMNFESSNLSVHGLPFVIFTHSRESLLPILVLRHLSENFMDKYNWFFLFPDTTYVDRESLEEFVDQFSAGETVMAGVPREEDERVCNLEAGILLSQAALKLVSKNLQKCLKLVQPHLSASQNIVLCLSHVFKNTSIVCFSEKKLQYRSRNQVNLESLPPPSDVISITHLSHQRQFYLIHRQLAQKKLKKCRLKEKELEEQSSGILDFTPSGRKTLTWPLGSQPKTRPDNRFDLLEWQYFTENTLYHERLDENYEPLKDSDKLDVKNVLKAVLNDFNKNSLNTITLKKLINGYRRFDVARGAEYILDLSLERSIDNKVFTKRAHYFKGLGDVEVVPTPYVSESTRVTLLLVVTYEMKDDASAFVKLVCEKLIDARDNSELLVVLVLEDAQNEGDDVYSDLKSTIDNSQRNHGHQGRMTYTYVKSSLSDQTLLFHVLDDISTKLSHNTLIAMCSLGMELKVDYINHVRMSTIRAFQVYFPVAFWAFQSNLVQDEPTFYPSILINQKSGHYRNGFFAHSSFYLSDYLHAREEVFDRGEEVESLYEMFMLDHSRNVLRAVDSALRVSVDTFKCFKSDWKCFETKRNALASRSQMAMLLFNGRSVDD